MQKQVEFGTWLKMDTSEGIIVVPEDVADITREDFTGKIFEEEIVPGWGARMHMPGYMDSTEWALFDTEEEALEYLEELYE